MNNFYRNLFTVFGISLALCIVSFLIFLRIQRISYYKSAIPEKLEVNHVVLQGDNSNLSNFVFGESCGGGVFKLSKFTIDAINSEGLSFFEDATQSRGIQSRGGRFIYPAWKRTPVPYIWTSNGAWTGLDCISNSNTDKLIWKITKTSESPGSYYTDVDNYSVVVLPELGFVTFTYAD